MSSIALLPSTRCHVVTQTLLPGLITDGAHPLLPDLCQIVFRYATFTYEDEIEFDDKPGYFKQKWRQLLQSGNRLFRQIALATDLFRFALSTVTFKEENTLEERFLCAHTRILTLFSSCPTIFDLACYSPRRMPQGFTPYDPEIWGMPLDAYDIRIPFPRLEHHNEETIPVASSFPTDTILPPIFRPHDPNHPHFLATFTSPERIYCTVVTQRTIRDVTLTQALFLPLPPEVSQTTTSRWALMIHHPNTPDSEPFSYQMYHSVVPTDTPTHNGIPITELPDTFMGIRDGRIVRMSEEEYNEQSPERRFR